jgi:phosphoribosyl 1,2-cyclic phosphodiesterase
MKMYTLGIPDRQKRRTLGYLKQNWVDFEESPSMEGFFDLSFPGMGEDAFKDIVIKLKQQGVTIIGADEELTERKIMKLTDLINEAKNLDEMATSPVIDALKRILQTWQNKQYADDRSRWEEYYMDIDELVTDFEEQAAMDTPAPSQLAALQEKKVRKAIRKLMRQ